MKKIVTIPVVLLVLLLVAPWGIGRLAEQRVNAGLDRIVEEAPYLSIVERKWTGGWFRSEQDVTFEVLGPWLKAMNPATVLDELKKAEQDVDAAAASDEPSGEEAGQQVTPGEEGAPPEGEPAEEAGTALKPIRFTVRNEVLHGPVLWPASLGIARVNTKLVLSDEIRKAIAETFGTEDFIRMSTRAGFFGGGTTRFYGDGTTVKSRDGRNSFTYDDYELEIDFSRKLDDVDLDGTWPLLEVTDQDGQKILLENMTLTAQNERISGDLYDTDFRFAIDKLRIGDESKGETELEGIHYVVDTSADGDFLAVAAKIGTGKVKSKALTALEFDLDEVHYDVTFRRLHTETLVKLTAALKEIYTKPVSSVEDITQQIFAPLKEHGIALLEYDPEFVIDRIGIVTPEGEGHIKGVLRLKGVTAEDIGNIAAGPMVLMSKLEADFTIEVAQKLIEKIPNGNTGAGVAIDAGYARRDGDRIVSRVEYMNGEVKVNGKVQPIPDFGGPPGEPAATRDPDGAEEN